MPAQAILPAAAFVSSATLPPRHTFAQVGAQVIARVAPVEPVLMLLIGTPSALRRVLDSYAEVATLTGVTNLGPVPDGRIRIRITVTPRPSLLRGAR